jgi:hypothetical protein
MANLAGVPQSRFFPAKLEAEGDDAIFNTLLSVQATSLAIPLLPGRLAITSEVRDE